MDRSKATCQLAILLSCMGLSVQAAEVNKWVDEDGITHYSDTPPDVVGKDVTTVKLRAHKPSVGKNENSDYYSIKNQWARLNSERIEKERLKLEREKLKAAQKTPPPKVVYVEEPKDADRSRRHRYGYVIGYPRIAFPKHRRGRYYKSRHSRHKVSTGSGYRGNRSGKAVRNW